MARKKNNPAENRMLGPKTGGHDKAAIEKLLTEKPQADGTQAAVTQLPRREILAAAAGVFQWRLCEYNPVRSAAHIKELVRALQATGSPFDALLVFPAGDKYFVIDGHHRLAAYEAADWNEPVPVEVFEGDLDEARLAALDRNRKDTLAMTGEEKKEAAWRLVKEDNGLTKDQLARRGLAANGTIGNMRAKWHAIKDAGDNSLLKMTWAQAKRWTPDSSVEWDTDGWRERKVKRLVDQLVAAGIATEWRKRPDLVAEALYQMDPNLPAALIDLLMDPDDVIERAQAVKDGYHRDDRDHRGLWNPPDAKDMYEF